jgi:ICEA Protein.
MTKTELFIKLANPDANGISRWVEKTEFTGEYTSLSFENGWSWGRSSSALAKKYKVERYPFSGKILKVRLNGFNSGNTFNQNISQRIKDYYKSKNCVMLGINGNSVNTRIEIDHKDGRKNDNRVSDIDSQKLEDFQPLCKAANDVKRQICKECKTTNKRWNAKNIKGNPYPYYEGDENYNDTLGCKGCYQYDPVEYRKTSVKRITKEVSEDILKKLYPEDE